MDRGRAKIVYCSIGYPANYHDIRVLRLSILFGNERTRREFHEKYGPVIADGGYNCQEFPGFWCPQGQRKATNGAFAELPKKVRNWSTRLDVIENRIENCFAKVFRNEFALLKRSPFPRSTDEPKNMSTLIKCAFILYNMQIDDTGSCILDERI